MSGIRALALATTVLGLCLFPTVCQAVSSQVSLPECDNKYDLVILLDRTDGVGQENFTKMLDFAKNLSTYVVQDPDHIQIGLDTFASSFSSEIPLEHDKTTFQNAVDSIGFTGGGSRNTLDALTNVMSASFSPAAGHRDGAWKQLILIMGGTSAAGQVITKDTKSSLRQKGIGVIAVGVGPHEDFKEFDHFDQESIHILPTYDSLEALSTETAASLCDGCGRKADVLFLLVASTVAEGSFRTNLNAVRDVVANFYLGAEFMQVGVDVFSNTSTSEIAFGQYSDRTDLNDALDNVGFPGGVSNISFALTNMMSQTFSTQSGHRDGVARIVVLFVADSPADGYDDAVDAALKAKLDGVFIIVVTVGLVNKDKLTAIATAVEDDNTVLDQSETIFLPSIICDAIPVIDRMKGCGTLPADIMFLLDTSTSIGTKNYEKIKDFLKRFTKSFKIGPDGVNMGVATFHEFGYKEFWMNEHTSATSLLQAIDGINRAQRDSTHTGRGLHLIRTQAFTKEHGDRANATNILIVITDGQSQRKNETEYEARELHKTSVTVLAVGIGDKVNETELELIGNGWDNVFRASNFGALQNLQFRLRKTACDVMITPPDIAAPFVTPENVIVIDGENINYTCNISGTGDAQPTFKWFKNGNEIPGATEQTYTFISSLKDNGNEFACSYEISPGLESNKSNPVTPKVRPQTPFIVPENVSATDGDYIIYSCQTPRPYAAADGVSYKWMLHGNRLPGGQNLTVHVFLNPVLSLSCIVESPTGGESGESQPVTPNVKPARPAVTPASIVEFDGNTITYTCNTPYLSHTPTFKWFRNGTAIPGATKHTFAFPSSLKDNSNTFSCSVDTTPGGMSDQSDPVSPTVRPLKPSVTPKALTVSEGSDITYTCNTQYTADDHIVFKWFDNGQEVAGETNKNYTFAASLEDHTHQYTCLVATASGEESEPSDPVSPVVTLQKPRVEPETVNAIDGEDITYTCVIPHSTRTTKTFHWYWLSFELQDEDKQNYTFTSSLSSNGITYSCRFQKPEGGVSQVSDPVTPKVRPKTPTVTSQTTHVVDGERISLICNTGYTSTASDKLTFRWFRNGNEIPGADQTIHAFTSSLADNDKFSCSIEKTVGGESDQSDPLSPTVRPKKPVVTPEIVDVTDGKDVSLTCDTKYTAKDHVKFLWFRNGTLIPNAENEIYSLSASLKDNDNVFSCKVETTPGGKSDESNSVRPKVIPRTPSVIPVVTTVVDGDRITYTCNTSYTSDVHVNYEWFQSGHSVPGATGQKHTFASSLEDNTNFSCRIDTTPGGQSDISVPVTPTVRPQAPSVIPVDITVNEGENITYTCNSSYSSLQQTKHKWFENGLEIPNANGQKYTFTSSLADNNDRFSCLVETTPGGESEKSNPVSPKVRPKKPSVVPEIVTVVDGENITYTCDTPYAAKDKVSFKWFQNRTEIPSARNQNYTFTSSLADNNRHFSCSVETTPGGESEKSDPVLPNVKPQKPSVSPKDISVIDGETITYICVTSHQLVGKARFRWYWNGTEVPSAEGENYTIASSLTSNSNEYSCSVGIVPGGESDESDRVIPNVRPKPPSVTPENVTVNDGDNIIFTCNTSYTSADKVSFKWFRNGAAIAGATQKTYSLTSSPGDNSNKFSCSVETIPGGESSRSNPVSPNVIPKSPSITPTERINVTDGETVTYTCNTSYTAKDKVSFKWFRNGEAIANATQQTYSFTSALGDNTNNFACSVETTPGGESEKSTPVSPNVSPKPPSVTPVSITVSDGEEISYTCNTPYTTKGKVSFKWFQNGTVIASATKQIYSFTSSLGDNSNNFACSVETTPGGESEKSNPVSPDVKPKSPSITTEGHTVTDGENITYTCNTSYTSHEKVIFRWFKNGTVIPQATQQTYSLTSSLENNNDKISCSVETTPGGESDQSTPVIPKVRPELPSITPESITVPDGEKINYTCNTSYTAKDKVSFKWFRNGAAIASATQQVYSFTSALGDNNNNFSCSVETFPGGEPAESTPVSPNVIPKIPSITPTESVTVTDGEQVNYTCKTSYTVKDKVSFKWFRNGAAIPGAAQHVYFTSSLGDNSNNFSCSVETTPGGGSKQSTPVSPTVRPKKPTVTSDGHTVTDGENITYTCKTSYTSHGKVIFRWFRNGTVIPQATQQTYSFTSSLENNNDKISCSVETTPGGESDESTPVIPKVGPETPSVTPESITVPDGEKINYTCNTSYTANHTVSFKWFRNGAAIADATQQVYSFTSALGDNNNNFSCSVETFPGGGPTKSTPVSPNVIPKSPSITPTESITVTDGEQVNYTCNTSYTVKDKVSFKWFRNGAAIAGATQQTYSFTSSLEDNSNNFSCSVETTPGGGSNTSTPVSPTVIPESPSVTPEVTTVTDGENVVYTCNTSYTAKDRVSFKWYRNGTAMSNATERIFSFTSSLADNYNNVSCSIETSTGEESKISTPVSPNVIPKPPFITPTESVNLTDGETGTYTCNTSYTANHTVSFKWFRNGTAIANATQQTYSFTSALGDNDDNFSCSIEIAPLGESPQSTPVSPKVTSKSPRVTPAGITVTDGQNITYTCNTDYTAKDKVSFQWFWNGTLIANATRQTYSFTSSLEDNRNNFSCSITTTTGEESPKSIAVSPNVKPMPPFVTPKSVTVTDGESITYNCNTSYTANHTVSFKWFVNGTVIANATQQTYSFTSSLPDNTNNFSCNVGIAPFGESLISTPVSPDVIHERPSVTPEEITVIDGENITFTCNTSYTANHTVSFKWFRNGAAIPNATQQTYSFTSSLRDNSNNFSCSVGTTPSGGSVISTPVSPDVGPKPPSVTPENITVFDTEKVTYVCNTPYAVGDIAKFKWFRNATAIPKADKKTYILTASLGDNNNEFSCSVEITTGAESKKSGPASPNVRPQKPTVTPESITVTTGEDITYTCNTPYTAKDQVKFKWFLNGKAIPKAGERNYTFVSSLKDNINTFSCSVETSPGGESDTSDSVSPHVRRPTPFLVPGDITVTDGENITFTCHTPNSSVAHVKFKWYKNGNAMPSVKEQNYTFKSSLKDNINNFSCSMESLHGGESDKSDPVSPHVRPRPPTVTPELVTVVDGENVTYTCNTSYTENDKVTFKWFKNGAEISDAKGQNYTFVSSLEDNKNKFSCMIETTPGGESDRSDNVSSKERPQPPTVTPELVTVVDGENVTYTCNTSYTGKDKVTFKWFKNGAGIPDAKEQKYTFVSSLKDNENKFSCLIETTPGGESEKSDNVSPKVRPQPPTVTPELVTVVDGEYITYTCNTSYTENDKVTFKWFKNGAGIPDAKKQKYIFVSSLKDNENKFSCMVETTPGGESEKADNVSPKVRRPTPFLVPGDITVTDGENITFTCHSPNSSVANVKFKWYKNGNAMPSVKEQNYTFKSSLKDNNSNFSCSIASPHGEESDKSDPVSPNVRPQPPTITPELVTVVDGENITYTCNTSYTGNEKVTFKWFKNGAGIPDAKEQKYIFISSLKDNENKFSCMVETTPGGESEKADNVSPKVRPQIPSVTTNTSTVTVGENITYTCDTSYTASDQVIFHWYRNGIIMPAAKDRTYTFTFSLVGQNDSFMCSVETTPGGESNKSDPVSPNVRPRPPTVTPELVTVVDGDNVTYTCNTSYTRKDKVTFKWFKNGAEISDAKGQKYTFVSSLKDNKNKFSCMIEITPGGESEKSDNVSPKVRPQTPSVTTNTSTVTVGENIIYTCDTSYTASDHVIFHWYRNGIIMPAAKDRTYTFTYSLGQNDSFMCSVETTPGGESNKSDPVSPNGHQCLYNGKQYGQGVQWEDGCDYVCECVDALTGNYQCRNTCPTYINLPPQCTLAPALGMCCLQPLCYFDPFFPTLSSQKVDKYPGFPSFLVDGWLTKIFQSIPTAGCVFNGQMFYQSQTWTVGCDLDCVCNDARIGLFICQSRCVEYGALPPNCWLVFVQDVCCAQVECEFYALEGTFIGIGQLTASWQTLFRLSK